MAPIDTDCRVCGTACPLVRATQSGWWSALTSVFGESKPAAESDFVQEYRCQNCLDTITLILRRWDELDRVLCRPCNQKVALIRERTTTTSKRQVESSGCWFGAAQESRRLPETDAFAGLCAHCQRSIEKIVSALTPEDELVLVRESLIHRLVYRGEPERDVVEK